MTLCMLSSTDDSLSGALRSVQQRFQEGGSVFWSSVVLVVAVGLIYLTYVISARLQRGPAGRKKQTPRQPFQELMQQLGLTAPHRRLLEAVAGDLHLPQPMVLLLSVKLFDSHMHEWHDMQRQLGRVRGDRFLVEQLRVRLFPDRGCDSGEQPILGTPPSTQ